MNINILTGVVTGWLICRLSWAIIIHCRAIIYDIKSVRHEREVQQHPNARQYRHRPLVSVLIHARNNELTIGPCLESIRTGSYRKYEIIIVDMASGDNTRKVIRSYIATHPKLQIRLVARRRKDRRATETALKYTKGGLLAILSPRDILAGDSLHKAVHQFAANPSANVLRPNIKPKTDKTNTIALLQQFEYLLSARARKAGRLQTSPCIIARREAIQYPEASSGFYAHDVMVYGPATTSYAQLFKSYKTERFAVKHTVILLLDSLVYAYLIYMAAVFHSTTLFPDQLDGTMSCVAQCVLERKLLKSTKQNAPEPVCTYNV